MNERTDFSLTAFDDFWNEAVQSCRVSKDSGRNAKLTVRSMVSLLPLESAADLRYVNIEEAIALYRSNQAGHLRPNTLAMYGSHARRGLREFLASLGAAGKASPDPTHDLTITLACGHDVRFFGLPDRLRVEDAEKIMKTVSVRVADEEPENLDLLRRLVNVPEGEETPVGPPRSDREKSYDLDRYVAYWQRRIEAGTIGRRTGQRTIRELTAMVENGTTELRTNLRRIDPATVFDRYMNFRGGRALDTTTVANCGL